MSTVHRIGRYEVIDSLGQGGMGIVYRATDPMLERTVAIKIISPQRLGSEERLRQAKERFYREARAVARLDSPFIVKIYDIGEEAGGIHYIVMECVSGRTLTSLIEGKGVPGANGLRNRLELFWQILQAMAYAHENGVVHRDLKPDNVMVTEERRVKVMDFGLAVLDERHSQTRDDQIMGTLAYFAPEQARGAKAVDHRADIYALGVMLFELVTGDLPFMADNAMEMITKVLEAPPPNPSDFVPDLPWPLEKLILQALKKNPADRFQSVSDMRKELEAFLQDQYHVNTRQLDPHSPPQFGAAATPVPKPAARPEGPGWASELMHSSGLFAPGRPDLGSQTPSPPPRPVMDGVKLLGPALLQPPQPPPKPVEATRMESIDTPAPTVRPPIQPGIMPFMTGPDRPRVASSSWGQSNLEEPAEPAPATSRMQRDDEVQAQLADPDAPRLRCRECGCVDSPPGFTHCIECNAKLVPSYFVVAREAAARVESGAQALAAGRYEEALNDGRTAVEKDGNLGEAHLVVGRAYLGLGQLEPAEEALDRAAELLPERPEPWLWLAELHLAREDLERVIGCWLEALDRQGDDTDTRCRLAFLFSELGRTQEALEQYRMVLRQSPRHLIANRQMGLLLAARDRNDEAIKYLEYANQLDPSDAQSCTLLGRLYARKRQYHLAQEAFQTAIHIKGDDPSLRAELGALYQAQNREDLAIAELRRALELDHGNREARLRLAALYERHQNAEQAVKELEEALRFHPQDLVVHRRLGELYLLKNDLGRAMLHFEKVVSLDPSCAEMHNRLGRIYLKKDYMQESIDHYKQAVDLHGIQPEYREDLAMAYYCAGDFPKAINELKKAAVLDSHNADYSKALGMLYFFEEEFEEAARHLQRSIQMAPGDPQAHGMLGQALVRQGLTNMALSEYQKALLLDPNLSILHLYLARAYAQAGRHSEAVASFRAFAGKLSASEETQFLGQAYVEMGKSYLSEGQAARAFEVFQAAVQRNPRDAAALHGLARVAILRKDFKKARERLREAMNLEPRNTEYLDTQAELHGLEGNWNEAVLSLQRALTENPADPDLHERLGRALRKGGRLGEAANTFRRGAEVFPARQGRFYWLEGRIEARRERWGEAAMLYRRALERTPQSAQILEDLAQSCYKLGEVKEALANLEQALEFATESEKDHLLKLKVIFERSRDG